MPLLLRPVTPWAFLLLGPLARAQIVEVEVRDKKAVRAQSPYVVQRGERVFLLGEPRWALEHDAAGRPTLPARELDLFVSDPARPEEVPYTWKGEEREGRWRARAALLARKDLLEIRVITAELTLENLAAEVRERRERIAALERLRAGRTKGSDAWFDALHLLLELHRRLQFLLERHGFEPAARALDDEVARLAKEAARDARWVRRQQALDSVRRVEPPGQLLEVAQAVSEGADVFAVHESRHLRLVVDARTGADEARALLLFGEELIEGFRREFVDPYPFPDLLPARVFAEFWLGPDDDEGYLRYFEEYYGVSWGTPEERREARAGFGRYAMRGRPSVFLSYYRRGERELRRTIAHRLGDILAEVQFTARLRDGFLPRSSWLVEAGGVDTAFQYFGLYSGTCVSLRKDSTGKESARERRWNERPVSHQLALARACPKPISQLVLRDLLELGEADLAKGWSLYCFFAADGERGQTALHAFTRLAREPETLLVRWREELRGPYGVEAGADPLEELERLWRASLPEEE